MNEISKPKIVILTQGRTEPMGGKTACGVLRYRGAEVVAVLDATQAGKTAEELLGVGGSLPVIASLDEAPEANTLLIGVASAGGKLPAEWQEVILSAISRGMDVVSGLHEFLADHARFAAAAAEHAVRLIDVRQNDERDVADGREFRPGCLRVLTVGQDCCVGKMVAALELTRALQRVGYDARFIATGQTGMMVQGDGCPVDCVVSDFVTGAVEKLIRRHQHRDYLIVEGQGSLAHPSYSPVTLGLMHGARPQGMILCYEAARPHVDGMPHVPLTSLQQLCEAYEITAKLLAPSRIIAVAANTRRLSAEEAQHECTRTGQSLGVPCCDVLRDGADQLVEAVLQLRHEIQEAHLAAGQRG